MEMDYFFWVIRGAARTVIVDTGFSQAGGAARGPHDARRPAGRPGRAAASGAEDEPARRGHPRALRPHRQPVALRPLAYRHREGRDRLLDRPFMAAGRSSIIRSRTPSSRPAAAAADGRVTTFGTGSAVGDGIEDPASGRPYARPGGGVVPTAAGRVAPGLGRACTTTRNSSAIMPFVSASQPRRHVRGFRPASATLADETDSPPGQRVTTRRRSPGSPTAPASGRTP